MGGGEHNVYSACGVKREMMVALVQDTNGALWAHYESWEHARGRKSSSSSSPRVLSPYVTRDARARRLAVGDLREPSRISSCASDGTSAFQASTLPSQTGLSSLPPLADSNRT